MAGDPHFNNVSLLLHMDGIDGSTTIADSSNNALSFTRFGNAQISTAQSKFGGASALFDGSGDYFSASDNAAFDLGSSDFTIEAWVYISGGSVERSICSQWIGGANLGWDFGVWNTNRLRFYYSTNGSSGSFGINTVITTVPTGQWAHVCACRSGNTIRLFINGTAAYTSASFNVTIFNSAGSFQVGGSNNTNSWNGYIDDLRITKGVARYTSNFTPPTEPFPDYLDVIIPPRMMSNRAAFINNRIHYQGL